MTDMAGGWWERVPAEIAGAAGPTVVCVGGLHGNEPAGLFAAQRVIERLRAAAPGALRGRVVAVAGNLAALNGGSARYIDRDLNRMFDAETIARVLGEESARGEERELAELTAVLSDELGGAASGSAVLDLHTFSSPSEPFAYVEDSLPARRLGLWLGLPLVVGLEEVLDGLLADWVTHELGVPAVLAEAGTHEDPASVGIHEAVIWVVLEALGMVDDAAGLAGFDPRARLRAAAGARAGRFYDVRSRVPVGDPPIDMLPGARAFGRVWKGLTAVGVRGGRVVRSPADGRLFMPNRQRVKRAEDDAFFVLRPIWGPLVGISGRLRKCRLAHRVLALLPGIRRSPDDPHALLVDHDVAALLARDVLHLLGYRILRSRPARYRRRWLRALCSLWVLPVALLRVLGVLPMRGDDSWVVRRHRLDVTR